MRKKTLKYQHFENTHNNFDKIQVLEVNFAFVIFIQQPALKLEENNAYVFFFSND